MVKIGFHASQEQFAPGDLLRRMPAVEEAGFDAVMTSDHTAPWSIRQGHSGNNWCWLGAALQATSRVPFASLAIPGNWRYHPLMVAQMAATLSSMFPGRFDWIAAGSGEALNEMMVGEGWPDKTERNARLHEGVDIIKALFRGDTVTRDGIIPVHKARLWDLPVQRPAICAAALSKETAIWAAEWAEGLLTIRHPAEDLRDIMSSYRGAGGQGEIIIQVNLSWADDEVQARWNIWDQWRNNTLGTEACGNIATPEEFDEAGADIDIGEMDKSFLISADPAQHAQWLQDYIDLGVDRIYIHNAGPNQEEFIRCCQREILPRLRRP